MLKRLLSSSLLLVVAGCQPGNDDNGVSQRRTTMVSDGSAVVFPMGDTIPVADVACDLSGNPIAEFSQGLKNMGEAATITGCEQMIYFSVGTANGNRYYGAVLVLDRSGEKTRSLVCHDEMVGHFEIKPTGDKVTRQQLVSFTVENCTAG
jgi:hypothetical protein